MIEFIKKKNTKKENDFHHSPFAVRTGLELAAPPELFPRTFFYIVASLSGVACSSPDSRRYITKKRTTLIVLFCGADGTRTRDPRRDRPVF